MHDPYTVIAPFYDWEHASFQEDIPLYREFARRCGQPVLELGCGTGRVLVPLAVEGTAIDGVDASEAMLAIGREKLRSAGVQDGASLHHADLTTFQLARRYRMAFSALDSFGMLLKREDQVRALCQARQHLVAGGLLVVDVDNGNRKAEAPPREFHHQFTAPHPVTGRQLTKFAACETDCARQMDTYTYFYDEVLESGAVKRVVARLSVRYFARFELELLLERSGFQVEALYGSYSLDPYGPTSERLIAVARLADQG